MRWTAILYRHIGASLVISTGIHTHTDVIKALMAGAQVTMMASALLLYGVEHIQTVLTHLNDWLDERGYQDMSVLQRCMSEMDVAVPDAFERGSYIKAISAESHLGYF